MGQQGPGMLKVGRGSGCARAGRRGPGHPPGGGETWEKSLRRRVNQRRVKKQNKKNKGLGKKENIIGTIETRPVVAWDRAGMRIDCRGQKGNLGDWGNDLKAGLW